MNEELRIIISIIPSAIILIVGYIRLFFPQKTKKEKFIEAAKAKGNYTSGEVVDTKFYRGNENSSGSFKDDQMLVTYRYYVNGVAYKKKIKFQSPGMISVRYPYIITVYYDPKKPAKGVSKEEATTSVGYCGTILLAALIFVVVNNILKIF